MLNDISYQYWEHYYFNIYYLLLFLLLLEHYVVLCFVFCMYLILCISMNYY